LNPQKSGDKLSSAIIFLLFKGLTRLEADHTIHCDLADSYLIEDNHRKYVFYLGEHFWSDGTPITAHDFVHSWRRALSPDFPLRATNFFFYLKNAEKAKKGLISLDKIGVRARDDRTLEVELEYPCPHFLELTSFCVFFPVPSKTLEDSDYPICNGPFQLERWEHGREILLKKNFHCKALFPVHMDAIHIQIVSNEKEAFNLFENDQLDWIGNPISPLPINYLPALLLDKKIKPLAGMTCCWFNTLKPPFSNVNLRRAFAYAMARDKMLEKLLLPNALSAKSFSPSIFPHSDPSECIRDCPETAKSFFDAFLKESKTKRLRLTLTFEATDEFSRMAALLKAYWEEIFQIRIQLEPMSFKEFWQTLPQQEFQLSLICSVSQYTDPINFLEKLEFKNVPINFSGWESAQYQALLKQYRKTLDHEKRQILAGKAESILFKEMPIAPICYYHYAYLQKPYVRNLTVSPIGVMQFDRVYLANHQQALPQEDLAISRNYAGL
jgi:oligopeptide transport system substrate-binding protein